jgi:hypothetical protein
MTLKDIKEAFRYMRYYVYAEIASDICIILYEMGLF